MGLTVGLIRDEGVRHKGCNDFWWGSEDQPPVRYLKVERGRREQKKSAAAILRLICEAEEGKPPALGLRIDV